MERSKKLNITLLHILVPGHSSQCMRIETASLKTNLNLSIINQLVNQSVSSISQSINPSSVEWTARDGWTAAGLEAKQKIETGQPPALPLIATPFPCTFSVALFTHSETPAAESPVDVRHTERSWIKMTAPNLCNLPPHPPVVIKKMTPPQFSPSPG